MTGTAKSITKLAGMTLIRAILKCGTDQYQVTRQHLSTQLSGNFLIRDCKRTYHTMLACEAGQADIYSQGQLVYLQSSQ